MRLDDRIIVNNNIYLFIFYTFIWKYLLSVILDML